ncbi:hypothetical protein CRG98_024757 [Punica granatum]|uniref:Uncharacterized protein n=1 Tax=Punica granatum TaxID=22663 RepID=A0A2I0JF62_PUNGR|nr:hypothetical protein CRG98_024757 [Punica granatum]
MQEDPSCLSCLLSPLEDYRGEREGLDMVVGALSPVIYPLSLLKKPEVLELQGTSLEDWVAGQEPIFPGYIRGSGLAAGHNRLGKVNRGFKLAHRQAQWNHWWSVSRLTKFVSPLLDVNHQCPG